MLKVTFSLSDIGDREENLDRWGHIHGSNWSISYLADGFQIHHPHYVDSLQEQLNSITLPKQATEEELLEAIGTALSYNHIPDGRASIVIAININEELLLLNVGDTRAYLIGSKTRTKDYSSAQYLIDEGKARPESLHQHPLRRYLRKSLCNNSSLDTLTMTKYGQLEEVMLCSDGVWCCFQDDNELYNATSKGPQELFSLALALRKENRDNMTLLWLEPS